MRWKRKFTSEELDGILDSLKRARAQYKMLCDWVYYSDEHRVEGVPRTEFIQKIGSSASALKGLCERGVLEIVVQEVSRLEVSKEEVEDVHALSGAQEKVLGDIQWYYKEKDCVLLQGVTSSGKTEIYIHLIQETLRQGKQVLYLLPEIALTVQIVKRCDGSWGQVGRLHSGYADSARPEMWQ